jgi:hypothetical protein
MYDHVPDLIVRRTGPKGPSDGCAVAGNKIRRAVIVIAAERKKAVNFNERCAFIL